MKRLGNNCEASRPSPKAVDGRSLLQTSAAVISGSFLKAVPQTASRNNANTRRYRARQTVEFTTQNRRCRIRFANQSIDAKHASETPRFVIPGRHDEVGSAKSLDSACLVMTEPITI
jgi:hypothetical protein